LVLDLIVFLLIIIVIILLYIIFDRAMDNIKKLRTILCPYCKKEIDKDAKICPYCRSELKPASEPKIIYCAQCGRRIYNEEQPCPSCGSYWRKYGTQEKNK